MRRVLKPIMCLLVLLLSFAPNLSACQLLASFGLTPHHHGGSPTACVSEHTAKPKTCCGHHHGHEEGHGHGEEHGHGHGDHHGHHDHHHDDHSNTSETPETPDSEPCSGDCLDSHELFFGPVTRTGVDVPSSALPFWNEAEDQHGWRTFAKTVPGQRAPPNEARPPGDPPWPGLTGCFLL